MRKTQGALVAALIACASATASAQVPGITTPNASPAATVSQTVGMTEVTVRYHRPAVNKRKIWGEFVPLGQVWRAGANENTTVTFSTPVKVQGKTLAAGTYGLHMIPTEKEWTVIFSKMSAAWGSFSYDEKEDALRVVVTPRPASGFVERLAYTIDDPSEGSAALVLHWEKLEVPVQLEIDTPEVARANIREQLRGLPRFGWQGWNQAARFWLQSGGDLTEATALADHSIGMQKTYANVTTRAMLLERRGDTAGATAARAEALSLATEQDINQRGYEFLLQEKKPDEAIALFKKNVELHPKSWNAHDSLGEALAAKGDKKGAAASYAKALTLVKDEPNRKRIEATLAQLKNAK